MNLLMELLTRFPWLEDDEEVSGADVVDALNTWYQELLAAEFGSEEGEKPE